MANDSVANNNDNNLGNKMKANQTFKLDADLIAGVAFDGDKVWASLITGDKGSLARINRKTGAIEHRVETPKIAGIAWDGTHIWAAAPDSLLRLDPQTLAVVKTLPRPAVDGGISGLAWDGEALWVGAYKQKKILKIDPITGATLREVILDRFVTGVTWVDGSLWHVADDEENPPRPTEMRQVNAETGAIIAGVELPFSVSGLDFDGETFWCGDYSSGTIRAVRKQA